MLMYSIFIYRYRITSNRVNPQNFELYFWVGMKHLQAISLPEGLDKKSGKSRKEQPARRIPDSGSGKCLRPRVLFGFPNKLTKATGYSPEV